MKGKMGKTYVYSVKCLACALHFNVYSWRKDWMATGGCPECGTKGDFLTWEPELVENEIYELVPFGDAHSSIDSSLLG